MDFTIEVCKAFGLSPFDVLQKDKDHVIMLINYFVEKGQETEIDIVNTIELNNPYTLLEYKYTEQKLENASWLLSQGQWNSGNVYIDAYNRILTIGKSSTSSYTDYDFVYNTTNKTFRLPLKTKYLPITENVGVKGNGYGMALTDGTGTYHFARVGGGNYICTQSKLLPPQLVGTQNSTLAGEGNAIMGLTTDSSISGLVVDTDTTGLYLYYYVGETVQNANLIDVGRLSEQLASKEDIDTWVYWQDGTSGLCYNKRNGFCIQWGQYTQASTSTSSVTISLIKKYVDDDFGISLNASRTTNNSSGDPYRYISETTQNSFTIMYTMPQIYWQTFGKLAEGQY